jgi:hypothetical protein
MDMRLRRRRSSRPAQLAGWESVPVTAEVAVAASALAPGPAAPGLAPGPASATAAEPEQEPVAAPVVASA